MPTKTRLRFSTNTQRLIHNSSTLPFVCQQRAGKTLKTNMWIFFYLCSNKIFSQGFASKTILCIFGR